MEPRFRNSVALDSSDIPHISYSTKFKLKYARWTGSAWNNETVSSASGSPSIAVDSNDSPHISYSAEGEVKYARAETDLLECIGVLSSEVEELPDEAFSHKLADVKRNILLREMSLVEKFIERGKYSSSARILERLVKKHVDKWIDEPRRTDLIGKINYILSIVP